MIKYDKNDINYEAAFDAYRAISHVPDQRADAVQEAYMAEMKAMEDEFGKYAREENRLSLGLDLERYRMGYISKQLALLSALSRCMSAMVTGPANFPTRRNERRNDTADKRRDEFLEWMNKTKNRMRNHYDTRLIARRPISSGDSDAIEKLQAKIGLAEESQRLMKAANKIIRKKITNGEKIDALEEIGLSEGVSISLLFGDHSGRRGYPSYKLTNNNANIRRMKARIEELKREGERGQVEDKIINGVTVSENKDITRLQLFFEGKPSPQVRKILKSHGFKWAGSQGAWQRLLNDNARRAAEQVLKNI